MYAINYEYKDITQKIRAAYLIDLITFEKKIVYI